ncbi:hypothetical protein [Streptomyces erythrochromogenes]|uniref:hypothetical protein n=1 Tax=Streptomyces erythrochromogenes TaxID=285574 RepID=UPI002252B7C0|nr:hypothetical protein [Streptomyces erythrochromogenes]MCX5584263.1 hypothetical protein [Streptomyces erythrochromogenes]
MPAIDAGISVATGGTCLGAAGVLFVADRLPWINKLAGRIKSPQIQTILVLTASIGLISTPVGQFLNRMVTLVDVAVSGIVGQYTGVGISFALALAALLWLISDFATGVKPRTLLLAAVTPFLAVMIPGSLGEGAAGLLGFIATQVGSLIGLLLGM